MNTNKIYKLCIMFGHHTGNMPSPAPQPPLPRAAPSGRLGGNSPLAGVAPLPPLSPSPPHEAAAGQGPWRSRGLRRRGMRCSGSHRRVLDLGGGPRRGPLSPAVSSGVGAVPAIWSGGRRIFGGLGPRMAALVAGGVRSGCWPSSPARCVSPSTVPGCAGVWPASGLRVILVVGIQIRGNPWSAPAGHGDDDVCGRRFLHGDAGRGLPFHTPPPCFSGENLTPMGGGGGILDVVTFLKASP